MVGKPDFILVSDSLPNLGYESSRFLQESVPNIIYKRQAKRSCKAHWRWHYNLKQPWQNEVVVWIKKIGYNSSILLEIHKQEHYQEVKWSSLPLYSAVTGLSWRTEPPFCILHKKKSNNNKKKKRAPKTTSEKRLKGSQSLKSTEEFSHRYNNLKIWKRLSQIGMNTLSTFSICKIKNNGHKSQPEI